MAKVRSKAGNEQEAETLLNEFWLMIAALETKEEVKNFFRDLLNKMEAIMLARRVRIAKLLLEGKTYNDVQNELHASPITIAKVQRWLSSGFGGYSKGVSRLEDELKIETERGKKRERLKDPFSFESLKRKYPLHFLLLNIFDSHQNEKNKRRK